MGKRRKRLTMAKYAKKYATKRAALGFDTRKVENKMIEIDMTSGEEIKEEEIVQVVSNKEPEKKVESAPLLTPEPELQVVQIEEPQLETPPPVEKKKPVQKKTTRRRRTTKKTEE